MKKVKGDLLEMMENAQFDIMVHGCNCLHAMGSGIAGQIARRPGWQAVPQADKEQTKKGDRSKLGSFSSAVLTINDHEFVVLNAYTQYAPRTSPEDCPVDYTALVDFFRELGNDLRDSAAEREANGLPPIRVAYPQIGCGLAGGDWRIVEFIIDTYLVGLDHTCVEYSK
tara:strand:- start:17751 stop:18257 length:507 start_codon:yes stop_codon:yes gene_type:complete